MVGIPRLRRLVAVLALVLAGCGGAPGEDGHTRMVKTLADLARNLADHPYIGDGHSRSLRAKLAALPPDASPVERIELLHALGADELRLGHAREAIELLQAALALAKHHRNSLPGHLGPTVLFRAGVAYLRLGETENCCARWTPESCVLPIRGGGVHEASEGSEKAIVCFVGVAESVPPDDPLYRSSVWLMNLAAMTLGRHPQAVPESYRIPKETFEAGAPFPAFANIAPELGLDRDGLAGGAAADDFDGDGDLDLVVSCWDPRIPLCYWRNEGDGRFTDRTAEAGLEGILGGLNLMQVDVDNDGDLDLFVLRGAWLGPEGCRPNSLLLNDGEGRFRDVTFEAGLADVNYPTQAAAWADYDNDGDLDLYIGNEGTPLVHAPAQLFRNRGDGTFVDVAEEAGVRNGHYAKGVAWGDFDGDRWPDLYVSNYNRPNRLYRNRGDGTFEDVAGRVGVTRPHESFPTWFWDYDNDGCLDLFVGAYSADVGDVATWYMGGTVKAEPARLYRGDGKGGFTDVAKEAGLLQPTLPMGANFGDLDNDGWLDFYLGTGNPVIESLMPNLMYRNRGGGLGFENVTAAGRFGNLQKGHGIVFADFDQDGDQDVFEEMGGAYPVDPYRNAFYVNPGFGNHWVAVQLIGRTSNRWGVGARIRAVVEEDGAERSIYKHVNSGGSFGANPLRQTIGLGKAARIARLEVYWPTSDTTQVFEDVPMERWILVTEGAPDLATRTLRPFHLGRTP